MNLPRIKGKRKPISLNDYNGISKKILSLRATLVQMEAVNKALVKAFNRGKQSLTIFFRGPIKYDVIYFFTSKGFDVNTSKLNKLKPYKLTISWKDNKKSN